MSTIDPQIGKNLREARRHSGITQDELAQLLGVDKVTVSRWERGVRRMKAEDYHKAMEYLANTHWNVAALASYEGKNVPRGTTRRVSELAPMTEWSPNPSLATKIPKRAYGVAMAYCRRLQLAGMPAEEIEQVERLMVDSRYAQANKRKGHELSEEDHIMLIDATWEAVKVAAAAAGLPV